MFLNLSSFKMLKMFKEKIFSRNQEKFSVEILIFEYMYISGAEFSLTTNSPTTVGKIARWSRPQDRSAHLRPYEQSFVIIIRYLC